MFVIAINEFVWTGAHTVYAAPVGPVGPVGPLGPVIPNPVGPLGPVDPEPVDPVGPMAVSYTHLTLPTILRV